MSQRVLLYPMAAMVLYTLGLAIANFVTRVAAVKSGQVPLRYFKTFTEGAATERVVVLGRHYDHQFQLPTWFLVTCATALAIDQVTDFMVSCAWAFVLTRGLHSLIHLKRNHPLKRAFAFALGWFVLIFMWGDLVLGLSRG